MPKVERQLDPTQLQWVVDEVVKRLCALVNAASSDIEKRLVPCAGVNSKQVLKIEKKIVSLEDLRNSLEGIREIQIPKSAIVTPSVKDELNDRSIMLTRIENQKKIQVISRNEPVLIACRRNDHVSVKQLLNPTEAKFEVVPDSDLDSIFRRVELADKLMVLATKTPFEDTGKANRRERVRAAYIRSRNELQTAQREYDLNLIVLKIGESEFSNIVNEIQEQN